MKEIIRPEEISSLGSEFVINAAAAPVPQLNPGTGSSGLVAGTPVWTMEGLKPIEKIRVGDMVLSQPEAQGELTYKPVIKTLCFEDKELWCIQFYPQEERDAAEREGRVIRAEMFFGVIVTADHLFWAKEKGWVQAAWLREMDELKGQDGKLYEVSHRAWVRRSLTQGMGWIQGPFDSDEGKLVDFRDGNVLIDMDHRNATMNKGIDWWLDTSRYRAPVYNLEIADNHTYYTGERGLWVHNINL